MSQQPANSTIPEPIHQPFVPDSQVIPELSPLPVLVGAILGIVFGASSVFLCLKIGMTISASIPVAVISITLFRLFSRIFGIRKASILENNIVQTTGSAGESIAFGVAVTMPALLIMGYEMELARVMTVATLGGLLGVLMMIPLRRGLIVKQHGKLPYPEGTACAEVLIVGEQGGTNAKTVFAGFGVGFIFKILSTGMKLFKDTPSTVLTWLKKVQLAGELTPEMIGVGYIIGPATGCLMMAGGVLSYLVLIPMIKMFGEGLTEPLYPGLTLISGMSTKEVRDAYVLYIGAGAVAAGGLISVFSSIPLIFGAFKSGLGDLLGSGSKGSPEIKRTDRDLPMSVVLLGSIALVFLIWVVPFVGVNLLGALLIVLFGFIFVTVSSRLTGEIGSSSNPISGMTVSTLLLTCLIFLGLGWAGAGYRVTALSIAAIVCIAASNGGTTSQDLKTGFLIGATPSHQQIAILVGALTSALVIGATLLGLNDASTVYARPPMTLSEFRADRGKLEPQKEHLRGPEAAIDTKEYAVMRLTEPFGGLPPGKYLVNDDLSLAYIIDPGINGTIDAHDCQHTYKLPATNTVHMDISSLGSKDRRRGPQGKDDPEAYYTYYLGRDAAVNPPPEIGSAGLGLKAGKYLVAEDGSIRWKDDAPKVYKYENPKAKLMSLIIDGILTQKLPWILVLMGAFLSIILELCQVTSLPFAVGVYLPFAASVPIFIGGIVRWLVDHSKKCAVESAQPASVGESESSPAVLVSSGLIAGGSIAGILLALLEGYYPAYLEALAMDKFSFDKILLMVFPGLETYSSQLPDLVSVLVFSSMCLFIYAVGRQWFLASSAQPKRIMEGKQ